MALVEVRSTGWGSGWTDGAGNVRVGLAGTLSTTVYATSNPAGGAVPSFITDARGDFPGWVRPGTYTLTVDGIARTVEASSAVAEQSQATEETFQPIFAVDPVSAGAPKFTAYMNSAQNPGVGAGTYNRGVWFGWNAGRYLGGDYEAGKQGVYMGFEDNYYDSGGDNTYGVEWYVGYLTPDGSTIGPGSLRPFYFRVKQSDTDAADKDVLAHVDIGSGAGGNFSVMGSVLTGKQLFVLTQTLAYHRLPSTFSANNADAGGAGTLRLEPTSGYAQMDIVAPGSGIAGSYGLLAFKVVSTYRWVVAGTTGSFEIQDSTNGGRLHMQLIPGASDTAASTILKSSLKVNGNVGFFGTTPIAKRSTTANATDLATVITLANALKADLQAYGLKA